jgi:hypothetical protein
LSKDLAESSAGFDSFESRSKKVKEKNIFLNTCAELIAERFATVDSGQYLITVVAGLADNRFRQVKLEHKLEYGAKVGGCITGIHTTKQKAVRGHGVLDILDANLKMFPNPSQIEAGGIMRDDFSFS